MLNGTRSNTERLPATVPATNRSSQRRGAGRSGISRAMLIHSTSMSAAENNRICPAVFDWGIGGAAFSSGGGLVLLPPIEPVALEGRLVRVGTVRSFRVALAAARSA